MGTTVAGVPRLELQHWNNCRPAVMGDDEKEEERPRPGRKKKDKEKEEDQDKNEKQIIPEGQENANTRPVREKKKPIRYS